MNSKIFTAYNIGFAKWRVKGKYKVCAFSPATAFYISFFSYFSKYKKAVAQVSTKLKV